MTGLLSTAGAAEYLSISEHRIRDLVKAGELVPVRPGGANGHPKFPVVDLDAFIQRLRKAAGA